MPTARHGRLPPRVAPRSEPDLLLDILWSGALGSFASALAAAGAARVEGQGALQPLNATSHWLHGRRAGRVRRIDAAHTGVGLLTHCASALFWAVPYSLWLQREPERSTGEILVGGAATAAVAAAVDYLVMPRRLTPGWELAISRSGVAAAFVGLALGLSGGALLARSSTRDVIVPDHSRGAAPERVSDRWRDRVAG